MKRNNLLLVITSLLSILFMTFHATSDVLHAKPPNPEAGGSTLVAVPILVVWLYGTLLLAERRSGQIIMLIGGVITLGMPIVHAMGPTGYFTGYMANRTYAFTYIWGLHVLGVLGLFLIILAIRAMRGMRKVAGSS